MIERVLNMFGIGRATLIDDDGEMQLIQVTEGSAGRGIGDRVLDRVRRVAEFGFASVPPLGSEVLLARRGGERGQSMVIATSHRPSRPRGLKPGDTAIHDVRGARIALTADGLQIDCAGLPAVLKNAITVTIIATQKVVLDTPTVETRGDLIVHGGVTVTGNISSSGTIAAGAEVAVGTVKLTAHRHGGVQTGGGVSGNAQA